MDQVGKCALTILEPCFPDKTIVDLKVNSGALAGDNFTCRVYSIEATLCDKDTFANDANILTTERAKESKKTVEHFVLKCFPDNPDRCEFIVKSNIFEKEIIVYEELIPELVRFQENRLKKDGEKVNIIFPFPKYIVGNYEVRDSTKAVQETFFRSIERNYVIMEDLRYRENYRTTNSRFDGLDYNHCKVAIIELAKVHALSLAYRKTHLPGKLMNEKFSCLKETLITNTTELLRSTILENCAAVGINILEKEVSKDSPYFKKIKKFEGKILQIMAHFLSGDGNRLTFSEMINTSPNLDNLHSQNKDLKLKEEWHVFCHGDFWASNILFKYSEMIPSEPVAAKFVDFQLTRENCLTTDLIFLFYLSTTSEFRSMNMTKLVTFYFDTFVEICEMYNVTPWENFSLENLFKRLSKAKIWGTALSLLALPIVYSGADENQAKDSKENPINPIFEGVGCGDNDMTKMLATRLLQIAKEVVDEGII